jgi:hypothetical protein
MVVMAVRFPKSGLVEKVELLKWGWTSSVFFDALDTGKVVADAIHYKLGAIVHVDKRGDNGAIELNPLPGDQAEKGIGYRVISVEDGGRVKYAIEKYKIPDD